MDLLQFCTKPWKFPAVAAGMYGCKMKNSDAIRGKIFVKMTDIYWVWSWHVFVELISNWDRLLSWLLARCWGMLLNAVPHTRCEILKWRSLHSMMMMMMHIDNGTQHKITQLVTKHMLPIHIGRLVVILRHRGNILSLILRRVLRKTYLKRLLVSSFPVKAFMGMVTLLTQRVARD